MYLYKKLQQRPHKTAGALLLAAGTFIFMGIITAEAYHPASPTYTTRANDISDLALTLPSAVIFNIAMIVAGLLVIKGCFYLQKAYRNSLFTILLSLFGVGLIGVGAFQTGNMLHTLFASLTFISIGAAAVASYRLLPKPYRYFALFFGAAALYHLALLTVFQPILGQGGAERWMAYPTLIWLISFGGYLLGQNSSK